MILIYLVAFLVWIFCILQTIKIAKNRGANPFIALLFLILTGTTGPLGLVLVYMFMPRR